MDVETLLRDALAHEATDAPRAGDDFMGRAVGARSARRRRRAGAAGAALAVSALVVGLTVVSQQQRSVTAAPADERPGPTVPMDVGPAPSPAEQQAQLARELGIDDPPAVDVVRLVTPVQGERLVGDCMTARGWGEGTVRATTTVEVGTGFLSSSLEEGGYVVPAGGQARFVVDDYVCLASYPIDPAYVQSSGDPYVDSDVVVAAGPGEQLPDHVPSLVVAAMTEVRDGSELVDVSAAWVDGGDGIAITTRGSSACPAVPVSWTVDRGALAVTTGPRYPDRPTCSTDSSPYTVVLETPAGVDTAEPLDLTVDTLPLALPAAG